MIEKKTNKSNLSVITLNKQAYFNFFIKEKFEAGLVLQGWEVKSLRAGKVNVSNSYINLKDKEAFLFGADFTPLSTTALQQFIYDQMRIRKILLNHDELCYLYDCVNSKGYTLVALSLFWKNIWCKLQIGVAKGKKKHDKRNIIKEREWSLNKKRIMKGVVY